MLDKFLCIQNVGKFVNYRPKGQVNLGKLTLMFGENGRGKTTLVAIIRSLSKNDPVLILERKTVGTDAPVNISVKVKEKRAPLEFNEITGWNDHLPEIEIFDSVFVNENIYSGNDVIHENKKNLYSFILGVDGVQIATRIDLLDTQLRNLKAKIDSKALTIEREIEWKGDLKDFINLPIIDNLEQKISDAKENLKILEQSSVIHMRSLLTPLTISDLNLKKVQKVLFTNITGLFVDAEEKVKQHIKNHLEQKGGESWLEVGVEHLSNGECPFCGQSIDGLEIITAFQSYFNKDYAKLKQELEDLRMQIDDYFSLETSLLLKHQKNYESNNTLLSDWSEVIAINSTSDLNFEKFINGWKEAYSGLLDIVAKKQSQPLESIEASAFTLIENTYDLLSQMINSYNKWVEEVNLQITTFKQQVDSGDLHEAKIELKTLLATEQRFSCRIDDLCKEYQELNSDRAEKEKEKKDAKRELEKFAKTICNNYQNSINEYLKIFGVGFKIEKLAPSFTGGKTSTSFGMNLNDVPMKVGTVSTCDPEPSFKSGASEGDKSALAFAFFLAKLEHDSNLSNKVIVFDDPITSLDTNRKCCTKDEILKIFSKAKQVIVLSHDPHFLRTIWDDTPNRSLDVKTLCVFRENTDQQSFITEWDITDATKSEYYRDYFILCDYLEKPVNDMRSVARAMRPVLEGYYRVRFPREFPPDKWLGDFANQIRQAEQGHPLFHLQGTLNEINAINNFSKKYHHQDNSKADIEPITDGELQTFIQRTLKMISGENS